MANYSFENISYNENLYYPRDTVNYLVKGTQASSTNLWTGNLPNGISTYSDGLTIDYFLPYAGNTSGATLNLGGIGAKPIYSGDSNTQITNEFPQYSVIRLTYIVSSALNSGNGCWKVSAYYSGSSATGTVTSVSGTTGLTGTVTTSGSLKANLKSETALTNSSTAATEVSGRVYPIVLDHDGYLAVNVPWTDSHQTIKQDGVTGATGNHYGVCSTGASTAAKTANITAGTPTLETGLRIIINFTNTNTADSPTLNINSLGAKNIFHNGTRITTGDDKALLSGVVELVYDGTQWQIVSNPSTYTRKTPVQGGTDLSLVYTGDMYNWNNSSSSFPIIATYDSVEDRWSINKTVSQITTAINAGNYVYIQDTSGVVIGSSEDIFAPLTIDGSSANDVIIFSAYDAVDNQSVNYVLDVETGSLTVSFESFSYDRASNTILGLVKPWYYHTSASTGPTTGYNSTAVAVNTITTSSGRYYAVESDVNGRMFVNVPLSTVKINDWTVE